MALDSKVWGTHYWFFLHTVSLGYPQYPNAVTKKKYYEFVNNIPLFIPVESMSSDFSKLLDKYPITPYLDSKESFVRWMHFIHNKINEKLEKPKISLYEFYASYYENYKPTDLKQLEFYKWREKFIYIGVVLGFVGLIYYLYKK